MADGTASLDAIDRAREIFAFLFYIGDYQDRGFVGENMFIASIVREALKPSIHRRPMVIALLSDYYEVDMKLESQRYCLSQARDIFGNLFRPVAFSPEWRTSTALLLARQMYESRDFSAMPILADALQDAGCEDADILAHCRGPGPHGRGCWCVDLVLGNG